MRESLPMAVLGAAVAAFVVAALDVGVVVWRIAQGIEQGPYFGTLVRDGLMVLSGGFVLRRAVWARWTLTALFALGLVRVFSANTALDFGGALLTPLGLLLMLLPATRAWFAVPGPDPKPTAAP